jgi:hypothetical protein
VFLNFTISVVVHEIGVVTSRALAIGASDRKPVGTVLVTGYAKGGVLRTEGCSISNINTDPPGSKVFHDRTARELLS